MRITKGIVIFALIAVLLVTIGVIKLIMVVKNAVEKSNEKRDAEVEKFFEDVSFNTKPVHALCVLVLSF